MRSDVSSVVHDQDRVADFVVINAGVYSSDPTGGLKQNLEQMIGLSSKGQEVMLGLVVNPVNVSPQVVRFSKDTLSVDGLEKLSLSDPDALHKLAKLIGFFNSLAPE